MLLAFTDLWTQANGLEKVYWVFAIPSTLIFAFILVTTFIGGDGMDASPTDLDAEAATGIDGQYFTFKNLVGFFLLFSWTGIACTRGGLGPVGTVILSILAGTAMLMAMVLLFRSMNKMVESGTLRMENAVGRTGNVYMRIPATRGGMGKVQITLQGAMRELDALTDDGGDLPTGSIVRVEEVIDGHILRVSGRSAS